MTFAVISNIMTMMLCVAVLIQSVRLMRAFDAVKGGALTNVVGALDISTAEARRVLGGLTELLRGDVPMTERTLAEGKAMIEELTVMTGIANAIAERIMDAAGANNRPAPPPAVRGKALATPRTAPASEAKAKPARVKPAKVLSRPRKPRAAKTPSATPPAAERTSDVVTA